MSRAQDDIRELMEKEEVTWRGFSKMLGEYPNQLHEQVNKRNDLMFDRYVTLADMLGYELEVKDEQRLTPKQRLMRQAASLKYKKADCFFDLAEKLGYKVRLVKK